MVKKKQCSVDELISQYRDVVPKSGFEVDSSRGNQSIVNSTKINHKSSFGSSIPKALKVLLMVMLIIFGSTIAFGLSWTHNGFETMKLDDNGNLISVGNYTLAQKITFGFGQVVDNIVDGWLRMDGNVNVTGNMTVMGNSLTVGGTEVCLEDGTNCQAVDEAKTADNNYLFNDSTTMYFNETLMNQTIDARANALERDTNITGDGTYLTDDGAVMSLNETVLNQTIRANDYYVNETGDTMTGDLNVSGADIHVSDDQYIYFGNQSNASIKWDSTNGRLVIKVN